MELNSHLDYEEYKRKRMIPNTLKKYITTRKDILETASHHDVVYRISCNDCDASYWLNKKAIENKKFAEHSSDINKKIRFSKCHI